MSHYEDRFYISKGDWQTSETKNVNLQIRDGLFMEHTSQYGWSMAWRDFGIQYGSSFVLRTKISQLKSNAESFYGIIWNYDKNTFGSKYLYLLISSAGQFTAGESLTGTWHPYVDWSPLPAQNTNLTEITIALESENLRISINGYGVLNQPQPDSSRFYGTHAGFLVGPYTSIKVSYLSFDLQQPIFEKPTSLVGADAVRNIRWKDQDDEEDEEDDDDIFINARGYQEDEEGNVLIDGEWVSGEEAEAQYDIDDTVDGLIIDDD